MVRTMLNDALLPFQIKNKYLVRDLTYLEDAEGCGAAASFGSLFGNTHEKSRHGNERFLGCVEVVVVRDLQPHLRRGTVRSMVFLICFAGAGVLEGVTTWEGDGVCFRTSKNTT